MTIRLLCSLLLMTAVYASPLSSGEPASSPETVRPLLPGMKVPEVSIGNLDGETVSISQVLSGKPTVLIFYRGGW